jgi:hypothetical protein
MILSEIRLTFNFFPQLPQSSFALTKQTTERKSLPYNSPARGIETS